MKSITDILCWVIGLAATALAVYFFFWKYKQELSPGEQPNPTYLWLAIGCTVVAFLCALVFFVRRVNKEEEIHITQ